MRQCPNQTRRKVNDFAQGSRNKGSTSSRAYWCIDPSQSDKEHVLLIGLIVQVVKEVCGSQQSQERKVVALHASYSRKSYEEEE
ncbi:hypothetical protein QVD17_20878 [Tagetes erecta]|uniref:Uncharacterized protein n=1 Tax=Tagetes erecta TaxID=13708 RepID=A0AAD8KM01_TARER|nr:hypothetical protein QVD17_20878 [Tagetes erecta]